MVKNGFNYMQTVTHNHWYNIYIYNNRLKRLNGFASRLLIVFDWNVTSKVSYRQLGRVKYKFRKKLSYEKRVILEIRVFVAMANDLLIILRGKGLQAVINGNEAEMDETGLEVEGKGNGGNSALFNLKDTAILYDLLNLLL